MDLVLTRVDKPRLAGAGFPSSPMRDPQIELEEQTAPVFQMQDSVEELATAMDALYLPSDISMASAATAVDIPGSEPTF